MNQSIKRDLQQLEKMLASYEKLSALLKDSELPIYKVQSLQASLLMLREAMADKTRDVRRRLREASEY